MNQESIERFEILSTFPVTHPACAVYLNEDGSKSYSQVYMWAMVKEHRYIQDRRGLIRPEDADVLIDDPKIEGIVKEIIYDEDPNRPIWFLGLACDVPTFEGYVDGQEGRL